MEFLDQKSQVHSARTKAGLANRKSKPGPLPYGRVSFEDVFYQTFPEGFIVSSIVLTVIKGHSFRSIANYLKLKTFQSSWTATKVSRIYKKNVSDWNELLLVYGKEFPLPEELRGKHPDSDKFSLRIHIEFPFPDTLDDFFYIYSRNFFLLNKEYLTIGVEEGFEKLKKLYT